MAALGPCVRLDPVLLSENDPIFLHAGLSVERSFFPVEHHTADGNFYRESSGGGMVRIKFFHLAAHDHDVWLRHRVYQTQWPFHEHRPSGALQCQQKEEDTPDQLAVQR